MRVWTPLFTSRIRGLTALLAAAAAIAGGCGRGASSNDEYLNSDIKLEITVTEPSGSSRVASVSCVGNVTGTGYLGGDPRYSGSACITASVSGPVVDFLQSPKISGFDPTSRCPAIIQAAAAVEVPYPPVAKAVVTGIFLGHRTRRTIDGASKDPCQRALWKIMQPLFTPSTEEIVAHYRPGSI